MRRRVLIMVFLGCACAALFVAVYATRSDDRFEALSWMASIISMVFALLTFVQAIQAPKSTAERVSTPAQLDQAERALRSAMQAYLLDELARRGLDDVLIPLRWRSNGDSQAVIDERGALVTPLSRRLRLIVAGEEGLGKTTACLTICRALIGDSREAVPVLIPATSWRAGHQSLERWVSEWVTSTVRVLGNTTAYGDTVVEGLLNDNRIRCVIDGLDELSNDDQHKVLATLAQTGARTSFIITSRPGALRKLKTRVSAISGVEKVEILPSRPSEALGYLVTVDSRFQNVEMASVERLLLSPLTVYLMRYGYFDLDDPAAANESAVRQLWRKLVPAMLDDIAGQETRRTAWYRSVLRRRPTRAWSAQQAQRWLSFLASDLAEPNGELRWWTFRKHIPGSEGALIAFFTGLALLSEEVEMLVAGRESERALTALLTFLGLIVMVKVAGRTRWLDVSMVDVSRGAALALAIGTGALVGTSYGWLPGISALVLTFVAVTVLGAPLVARSMRRQRSYISPAAAVRTARRVTLISSVPTYVVIITAMYMLGNNAPFSPSVAACVFTGHLLLASVWGGFLSARLAGGFNQRLSLRLNRFLEDMSEIGLLRRVGTHYAFRHALLRKVLAAKP